MVMIVIMMIDIDDDDDDDDDDDGDDDDDDDDDDDMWKDSDRLKSRIYRVCMVLPGKMGVSDISRCE